MASSTDFIADFLTVVRNASRVRKEKVTARASRLAVRLAEILKEEGFIESYKFFTEGERRFIRMHLRYIRGRQPAIQGIQRVSTPGRRVYVGFEEIPRVLGGLGIAVVSTSKGVMVDREARKARVGGELICKVW
jgi:small subunit ribosomal protein S8